MTPTWKGAMESARHRAYRVADEDLQWMAERLDFERRLRLAERRYEKAGWLQRRRENTRITPCPLTIVQAMAHLRIVLPLRSGSSL